MLFVANMSFNGYRAGEIVRADPDLIRAELDAGFFSEVDEHGHRVIPVPPEPASESG